MSDGDVLRIANIMLSASKGGLEQAAVNWQHALQSNGHSTISLGRPQSWFSTQVYSDCFVPFHVFNKFDPTATWRLGKRIPGADAVVCHGNRAMEIASKLANRSVRVGIAHNARCKDYVRRLDGMVAVSKGVKAALLQRYPDIKCVVVPNLVRRPFSPSEVNFAPRLRVGSIGRLHRDKGFDVLINASVLLRDRGFEFDVVIGGDGPERGNLVRLIRENNLEKLVRLPGWIDRKEDLFSRIDLFVLPSRVEPFGIALLEAMAHGIPVIATEVDGPAEIIARGQDGILAPSENAEHLAEAIVDLARDSNRAAGLRAAALEKISTQYSFDVVSRQMSAAVEAFAQKSF